MAKKDYLKISTLEGVVHVQRAWNTLEGEAYFLFLTIKIELTELKLDRVKKYTSPNSVY